VKIIFYAGLILNVLTAILTSLQYPGLNKKILNVLTAIFLIPLLMSCVFLFDAFRRFRGTKRPQQVINNKQVGLLAFAFAAFAVALLVSEIRFILDDPNNNFDSMALTYELAIVAYWASTLILALVLFKLIFD